jgi:hypothetical protein
VLVLPTQRPSRRASPATREMPAYLRRGSSNPLGQLPNPLAPAQQGWESSLLRHCRRSHSGSPATQRGQGSWSYVTTVGAGVCAILERIAECGVPRDPWPPAGQHREFAGVRLLPRDIRGSQQGRINANLDRRQAQQRQLVQHFGKENGSPSANVVHIAGTPSTRAR